MKDLVFKLREKQREKRKLANEKTEAFDVIDLDIVPSPTAKDPSKWVSDLTTEDEKVLLTDGELLMNRLINARQKMIKGCYPHVCGLQDVSLGHTLGFNVQEGEFVQVLCTASGHWVTISNIGCKNAEVHVFDSMAPALSSSLQK